MSSKGNFFSGTDDDDNLPALVDVDEDSSEDENQKKTGISTTILLRVSVS